MAEGQQQQKPQSARAASSESPSREGGEVKVDDKSADLPVSTPESIRVLAEDLPENDAVQVAHKEILTAESPEESDKAKADLVAESPRAYATPSGYAAQKVAGISNDTERGEKYAEIKSQVRHGTLPDDASGGEPDGV